MRSNVTIVAADVDGTIVTASGRLPAVNADALVSLSQRGVRLVLMSARTIDGILDVATRAGVKVAAVAELGAVVADLDGTIVERQLWPEATARELIDFLVSTEVDFVCTVADINYGSGSHVRPRSGRRGDHRELHAADLSKVTRIVVRDPGMLTSPEARRLLSELAVETGSVGDGQEADAVIVRKGVSKLVGLECLLHRWGESMSVVLAVGDSAWDDAVVRAAGVGVVVAGASPELRRAADWVAPSAEEGGFAAAVTRYL